MIHRVAFGFATLIAVTACATEPVVDRAAAERGYKLLVEKAYLPPDFDQETFDNVWKQWPEPLRTEAEKATPDERRQDGLLALWPDAAAGRSDASRCSTSSMSAATGR